MSEILRNRIAQLTCERDQLKIAVNEAAVLIKDFMAKIESDESQIAALEADKRRLDWLQSLYSQSIKNNPEVPFGLLTVPLDLNYNSLRAAIDAATKPTP